MDAPLPYGLSSRASFRGCLLGGAIGDALGAPVEFDHLAVIRRRHGPAGVTGYPGPDGRGAITDDTQLTLFTAEGLIRADNRLRGRGIASVEAVVHGAYRRWLRTQGRGGDEPDPYDGWLVGLPGLNVRRAPGATCLAALESGTRGTREAPINNSKGCGAVMRMAPVGLVAEEPFELGGELGALTHGHPTGWLAAACFAELVGRLVRGESIQEAAHFAQDSLRRVPGHEETLRAVQRAVALAAEGSPSAERVESLGRGWVAEEALAIGLYAALVARDFAHGVLLAVNHSGDSDSTGSIAGNLLGLEHGEGALPAAWVAGLELAEVIGTVGDDLWEVRFGRREVEEGWAVDRYPGV